MTHWRALAVVLLLGSPFLLIIGASMRPVETATPLRGETMRPIQLALLTLAIVGCDTRRPSCVWHQRDAFDQCMGKGSSRANECIDYAQHVFENCAKELTCSGEPSVREDVPVVEQLELPEER